MRDFFMEKQVQRELAQLDPGLFLDLEKNDQMDCLYYVIRYRYGDQQPHLVAAWIDEFGRPLPLSLDLVTRVRLQEGDIQEAIKSVIVNNAIKKHNLSAEARKEEERISEEWTKAARRPDVIPFPKNFGKGGSNGAASESYPGLWKRPD